MKKIYTYLPVFLLLIITSCNGQNKTDQSKKEETKTTRNPLGVIPLENSFARNLFSLPAPNCDVPSVYAQVGEYLTEIFEDSNGVLWFGTLARGIARYEPSKGEEALTYYSEDEGLVGHTIRAMAEDKTGSLWFATHTGVSKYTPTSDDSEITFTNYTTEEGLPDNGAWSVLADRAGTVWVGTTKGVCRFNGTSFSSFELPVPDVKDPTFNFSLKCVRGMIEDDAGNIWFATDGYGACKYNPTADIQKGEKTFTHFTTKDGLCSNNVVSILEDQKGNIWFGCVETRVPKADNPYSFVPFGAGGLVKYDGHTFTTFPKIEGLLGKDIHPLYEDNNGHIWIGPKHYGLYRFDGERFVNFKEEQGIAPFNCAQSILEDKTGQLWIGFSGGLFRFNGMELINMTKKDL